MNKLNNTVYTHKNTIKASPYSLVKPSQSPVVSHRYTEDWLRKPSNNPRGLRRDLRALCRKITPHYEDALTVLLWACMIPTTIFIGTLAGY